MNGSPPSFSLLSSTNGSPDSYINPSSSSTSPTYPPALDPNRRSSVHPYPIRSHPLSPTDSECSTLLYQNPPIKNSNRTPRRESVGGNTSVGGLAALDASLRKDRLEEIKERNNKILNRISSRSTNVRDRDLWSQPGTPEPTQKASSYRPDGSSPSSTFWSRPTTIASSSPSISSSPSSPSHPAGLLPQNTSADEKLEHRESPSVLPASFRRPTRRSSFDSQPDEQSSESESEPGSESERVLDARIHSRAASAPYRSRKSPLSELDQRTRPAGKESSLGQNSSLPYVSDEPKKTGGRERREEILNRCRSRASLGYGSRAETPSFTSPRVPRSTTANDLGSPFPPASTSAARRRTASSFDLYSKMARSPTRSPEELNGSPASQPLPLPVSNRLIRPLSSSSNGNPTSNLYSSAESNAHQTRSRMHEPRSASRLVDRAASSIGFHSRQPLSNTNTIETDLFDHDNHGHDHERSPAPTKVANRTRYLLERIERENEASDRKRQALVENQAMKRAESSLSMFSASNGTGFQRSTSNTSSSVTDLNRTGEGTYPNTTGGIIRSSTSLSHFPERLSSAADVLRSRSRSHRSAFSLTSPGSPAPSTISTPSRSAAVATGQKRFSGSLSASVTANSRVRSPLSRGRRSSILANSPLSPSSTSVLSQTVTESQPGGQIQPEHIRNLFDALSHFETSLVRVRDPASLLSTETVRSASAFVKSATILHQAIYQGSLANRELVIDSQVNYGSTQAQEQGQKDMSEGLVSLGMTWKEAGKAHDEQVRALTDLLIGLPRWIREVVGSIPEEGQNQDENVSHLSSKPSTPLFSNSASIQISPLKNSFQISTVGSRSENTARALLSPTISSDSESEESATSSLSSSLSRQLSSLTIEPKAEVDAEAGPQPESDPEVGTYHEQTAEGGDEESYVNLPARPFDSSSLTPSTPTPSSFYPSSSPLMPPPSSSLLPSPKTPSETTEENSWQPAIKSSAPSISPSGATTNSARRSSIFPSAPRVSPAATTAATAIQAFGTNQSPSGRTSVEDLSDLSDTSISNSLPPLSAPLSASGQTLRLNMSFLGRSNTLSRIPASSSVGLGAGAASASTSGGPVVGVSNGLGGHLSVEQSLNNQSVKLGLRNGSDGKAERPGPVSSAFRKLSFFGGN